MADIKDREIFKVGTWRGSQTVTADTAMLDRMVASYTALNAAVPGFAIPIKLGHNKRIGEPAMGYATNVRRDGGTLLADFTDVPPEIVDAISAKRYNAVSVEVWPKVDFNGTTYQDVLSGVALLGAEWPAVKGLQPIYAFDDSQGEPLTLTQEETAMPQTFTQEQYDAAINTQRTEFTAQMAALTQRAETAEAALAAFADESEKKDLEAIITAAEAAGKIVPANKANILSFAETLRKGIAKQEDRKAAMATFKAFVEGLPKRVDFSEQAENHSERPGEGGATVAEEVNNKVKSYQTKNKGTSYADALTAVFSAEPELKNRYALEAR